MFVKNQNLSGRGWFGWETNNVFCGALCCPVSQVCVTPVLTLVKKLCPMPCLCHLLVPMSFCRDCGFVVRLAVFINQSLPCVTPSFSVLSSYAFIRVY